MELRRWVLITNAPGPVPCELPPSAGMGWGHTGRAPHEAVACVSDDESQVLLTGEVDTSDNFIWVGCQDGVLRQEAGGA